VEPSAAPQERLPAESAGRAQGTSAFALPVSPLVLVLPCIR
jgi:hypothetical protein